MANRPIEEHKAEAIQEKCAQVLESGDLVKNVVIYGKSLDVGRTKCMELWVKVKKERRQLEDRRAVARSTEDRRRNGKADQNGLKTPSHRLTD